METILAAIMGALANLAEPAVKDGYEALKGLFRSKTSVESPVVKAVESLEEKPGSSARQGVLTENISDARLDQDAEVLKLVAKLEELVAKLGARPAATVSVTQTLTGNYNMVSGTGNVTSTFSGPGNKKSE